MSDIVRKPRPQTTAFEHGLHHKSGLFTNLCVPRSSKCGGMATHAGLAIELGITRKKGLSPQMEAILIWCQCRTREYDNVNITVRTTAKTF